MSHGWTRRNQRKVIGRGEWIRTTGLLVPNQALYQAEPRPDECGEPQFNIRSRSFPACRLSQSGMISSASPENVSSMAPYSVGAQVLQC
jgi:hypothetical protein